MHPAWPGHWAGNESPDSGRLAPDRGNGATAVEGNAGLTPYPKLIKHRPERVRASWCHERRIPIFGLSPWGWAGTCVVFFLRARTNHE